LKPVNAKVSALPSPRELGLPPKYVEWRDTQRDGLEFILQSKYRVHGLAAPTGSGKTAIALALGVLKAREGKRTLILTETKGLQKIYAEEGAQMQKGLVANVSGAGNYRCTVLEPGGRYDYLASSRGMRATCDNGPCNVGMPCKLRDMGCTFYGSDGALQKAKDAKIVITNYANWFSAADQAAKEEKFGDFDLIVMDEGHGAADVLCNSLSVELDLRDVAHLKSADARQDMSKWSAWCRQLLPSVESELGQCMSDIKAAKSSGSGYVPAHLMIDLKRMQRVVRAVNRVATARGRWVAIGSGAKVTFKPVWPDQYCESHLLRGIPQAVMMSATLVPQAMKNVGLRDDQFDFMEMESSFPVERRPVYLLPCARMRWDMDAAEEQKMLDGVDALLKTRPDWRGIIHTVSYGRSRLIESRSRFRERMIDHVPSATIDTVERFQKNSPKGAVLISPAISTGYDFPDDQARFQILPKIPFPDTRDPVTAARIALDKKYLYYAAMQYIIQAVGRLFRHHDDYGETWLLDSNALWFFEAAKEFMTKSFAPCVKKVSGIGRAPKL
jgi:Rad3-related DNA helicase